MRVLADQAFRNQAPDGMVDRDDADAQFFCQPTQADLLVRQQVAAQDGFPDRIIGKFLFGLRRILFVID